jgi:hypothetical protein
MSKGLSDPFGEPRPEQRGFVDPFAYSNMGSLAVPIHKTCDGAASWEDTVADMLAVIANLTDPADSAMSGRLKRDNCEVLEQMRQAKRDAWWTIEHRLGDRDRELRE